MRLFARPGMRRGLREVNGSAPRRGLGALLLFAACAGVLPAKTWTVRRGGPLPSVREAIRLASPGDTVRVEAGIYPGNLVVDRQVVLEGEGRPVIRGDGRGSVVTITANGCTLRGFVIERSGPMLVDEDSGILLKSSGNRIDANELRDVLFGIYFFQSHDNVASENVIRGRPWLESGERGSAVHIWNSARNTLLRNVISGARDGMYLQNATQSVISGNRVHDLRYGLHYMFSDDNRFEDNAFYNNVAGAAIMYSHGIRFSRNAFVHNRGFSSFGILFQDSHDCVAEENTISDNAVGIFMEALTDTAFRRNTIAANDVAIQAFSSAARDTFAANNFVANLSPFQLIGKVTDLRWDEQGAGNYWSEYDGYDLDGDGVGDVPYPIQNAFEHLEGNYPRLRIYLFSPASRALAASERLFPVLERPKTADRFPLLRPAPLRVLEPERAGAPPGRPLSFILCAAMVAVAAAILQRGRGKWSKSPD